jgi:hypothetical protein
MTRNYCARCGALASELYPDTAFSSLEYPFVDSFMTPIRSFSHFRVEINKDFLTKTTFLLYIFFYSKALYQQFITFPDIIEARGQLLVSCPFVYLKLVRSKLAVHYISLDTLPSGGK